MNQISDRDVTRDAANFRESSSKCFEILRTSFRFEIRKVGNFLTPQGFELEKFENVDRGFLKFELEDFEVFDRSSSKYSEISILFQFRNLKIFEFLCRSRI